MAARYNEWLWWCASKGERSAAFKEFESEFGPSVQGSFLEIMSRWLRGECMRSEFGSLGSGLWELRHRVGTNHFRVLFFISGRDCVALTCFYKNQQRTPRQMVDRARKRMSRGHGCPYVDDWQRA